MYRKYVHLKKRRQSPSDGPSLSEFPDSGIFPQLTSLDDSGFQSCHSRQDAPFSEIHPGPSSTPTTSISTPISSSTISENPYTAMFEFAMADSRAGPIPAIFRPHFSRNFLPVNGGGLVFAPGPFSRFTGPVRAETPTVSPPPVAPRPASPGQEWNSWPRSVGCNGENVWEKFNRSRYIRAGVQKFCRVKDTFFCWKNYKGITKLFMENMGCL